MKKAILYVGPMDPAGTCYSRYLALLEIQPRVEAFDKAAALELAGNAAARFAEKFGFPTRRLAAANRRLIDEAIRLGVSLIWFDKADWVLRSTFRSLRARGIRILQHTTDALRPRRLQLYIQRALLRESLPFCDAFLTTNEADVRSLQKQMGNRLVHTRMGFDHTRFFRISPAALQSHLSSEICFIGHYEPRSARWVESLDRNGIPVVVFGGEDWARTSIGRRLGSRLRPPVWNENYVNAIRSTKIALCFLSKWNSNQTTVRTFEIPACGVMMLAMRTPEHERCFVPDREAAFFDDEATLVAAARRYLADDVLRSAVADAGRRRCHLGRHTWRDVMADDWEILRQRGIV